MDSSDTSPEKAGSKETGVHSDDKKDSKSKKSEKKAENSTADKEQKKARIIKDREPYNKQPEPQPKKKGWMELAGGKVENEDTEESKKPSEDQEPGLTEAESQEAATVFIDSRNDELAAELTEAEEDSSAELEILADVAFLESLREKLETGEDLTEDVVDEAFHETAEDLGVESVDTEELNEEIEDNIEIEIEQPEDPEESLEDSATNPPSPTQNNINPPLPPQPPNPPNPPAPPPPGPQPPHSPNPGFPNIYHGNHNTQQYNLNLPTANPNTTVIHYVERRRRGRDLLVGGIVGYIIGRRGGRKRTEKKLLPKIDTLEKEVGELHDIITEREERIRKLAKKAAESEYRARSAEDKIISDKKATLEKTKDDKTVKEKIHREKTVTFIENRQKRVEIKETLKRREELVQKESVEKLTKFTLPALNVFREKRMLDGSENSPSRKNFEIMTDRELLEKAATIRVNGVSVVEMYYAGRLDRNGVLEIVKKYYRKGIGSYETAFWKELKNDPEQLNKTRETLEKLHTDDRSDSKYRNNEVSNGIPGPGASDEEKQRYYQRYADKDQQVAPLKNISTNSRKIYPWVVIIVVVSLLFVGYMLITS